jgi:hypothetical protein
VTAGITYLLVGLFLFWVGLRSWKYRKQETISAIELAILKSTGEEPLPLTRLDWSLKYAQAILGFTLGPFFAFLGVILILSELDSL